MVSFVVFQRERELTILFSVNKAWAMFCFHFECWVKISVFDLEEMLNTPITVYDQGTSLVTFLFHSAHYYYLLNETNLKSTNKHFFERTILFVQKVFWKKKMTEIEKFYEISLYFSFHFTLSVTQIF